MERQHTRFVKKINLLSDFSCTCKISTDMDTHGSREHKIND